MKGDLPAAAVRLLSTSIVHTHERVEVVKKKAYRPRLVTGCGRGGNNAYKITIRGKVFASMDAARKAMHIGKSTLMRWIEQGNATCTPYSREPQDAIKK